MKIKFLVITLLLVLSVKAQEKDSTDVSYKKRVLESTEIDFLASYYKQDGIHSAVSGGKGMEELTDITPTIVVSVPLNDDDILTADVGISAYSSASSGNINPFDSATPSPWQASSGASAQDALTTLVVNYSHSSDDRNTVYNAHLSGSVEYDYSSIGFGGGLTKLFNDKNTEVNISANVYLDTWRPIYPKELEQYKNFGSLSPLFLFNDINSTSLGSYDPSKFKFHDEKNRNSYSLSLSFSQVLTQKIQFSLFADILQQKGLLSTPYQRVYFADKGDYFINEFQLADDIERLPDSRFKLPIGTRWNFYLNERFTVRTYFRYYWDNWGIDSQTANIEVPIKISSRFTVYPMYRYYTQNKSKYFAPYEQHLSTEEYYTSDYDLSTFNANQYGLGINYTDIFMGSKIWKFGLKNIDLRFNHYSRSDGLEANIISFGIKFVQQ